LNHYIDDAKVNTTLLNMNEYNQKIHSSIGEVFVYARLEYTEILKFIKSMKY